MNFARFEGQNLQGVANGHLAFTCYICGLYVSECTSSILDKCSKRGGTAGFE